MIRALLELIVTIVVVMIARAILTSVMRGIAGAANPASRNRPADPLKNRGSAPSAAQTAGELHKDPVCGTYVADSTPFRRQAGGQTFYYCSGSCREKHALVAH